MGVNSSQVSEVIACARRNKKLLVEGVWTRFFPAFDELRKCIENGDIGEIISYSGETCLAIPDSHPLQANKDLGGSLVVLGTYSLHMLPLLFGYQMPKQIRATAMQSSSYVKMLNSKKLQL